MNSVSPEVFSFTGVNSINNHPETNCFFLNTPNSNFLAVCRNVFEGLIYKKKIVYFLSQGSIICL